jgi:vacuolar-type H+-ATPase subunit F/Vma7
MSRLLVLTRPTLVPGFHLAGVEAYGPEDIETAQEMIESWIKTGDVGLLAIDDGLLERMDPNVLERLDAAAQLSYLAIPGGGALGPEASRRHRIAETIRRAVGFHITFKGEEGER